MMRTALNRPTKLAPTKSNRWFWVTLAFIGIVVVAVVSTPVIGLIPVYLSTREVSVPPRAEFESEVFNYTYLLNSNASIGTLTQTQLDSISRQIEKQAGLQPDTLEVIAVTPTTAARRKRQATQCNLNNGGNQFASGQPALALSFRIRYPTQRACLTSICINAYFQLVIRGIEATVTLTLDLGNGITLSVTICSNGAATGTTSTTPSTCSSCCASTCGANYTATFCTQ